MRILIMGGGGREHALAWAVAKSRDCTALFCAPGNAGIAEVAECVSLPIEDGAAVVAWAREARIEFVIVGPEAPLVAGVADALRAAGIATFGPSAAAAQLEASKSFTHEIAAACGAPMAAHAVFDDPEAALAHLATLAAPPVVKADGLAAGKGVVVAETADEARAAVDAIFAGQFGTARAVIEERLIGEEASLFALSDGETVLPLATAQDHKRVGEGDTGPNTGGMGAYSPAPVMTDAVTEQAMAEIVRPAVAEMARRGTPFAGVLYAGLMITAEGPRLIEFNVRFGDPECQVLALRLGSDLLAALRAAAEGRLAEHRLDWQPEPAITVVMAAKGYPGAYAKGSVIGGLDAARKLEGVTLFHAGTAEKGGQITASGGRVLNVSATGPTLAEAQARAYQAVDAIDWPEGFCRRDIGWQALAREP
ncbi:MAG: phosphoribosylamine--glycine ligase [Pseudomonadota bacterium]